MNLLFAFVSHWDSLNLIESYSKWLSIPSAVNLSWWHEQNLSENASNIFRFLGTKRIIGLS